MLAYLLFNEITIKNLFISKLKHGNISYKHNFILQNVNHFKKLFSVIPVHVIPVNKIQSKTWIYTVGKFEMIILTSKQLKMI